MNTKSSILKKVLYVIIPMAIIAVMVVKLKTNKEITQNKIYEYDKEQAVNVQADTLHVENVNAKYSYSGTFEPNKETKISAELQGKINTLLVDVGSVVIKGQTLVLLDNSGVKRFIILAKADAIQGVQLEKAELGLKSAKVQRAILLEQINKTYIKAPFQGVVTAKLSEEGAFAAPGVPLLQIT